MVDNGEVQMSRQGLMVTTSVLGFKYVFLIMVNYL